MRGLLLIGLVFAVSGADAAEPIAIGSRRELFVDGWLIDKLTGKAEQRVSTRAKSRR